MKNEKIESIIREAQNEFSLSLSPEETARSVAYLRQLLHWNRRISLTSVRDLPELVRYHLFEGFLAERNLPFAVESLADIGSGAGFPAIPMLILNPERKTWLIEKNLKKATFLSNLLRELSLPGKVINLPAEQAGIWSEVGLVSARALKLSDQLLEELAASGIPVMVLEGRESQFSGKAWTLVQEETFPSSKNRMIRIFRPDVSRETK